MWLQNVHIWYIVVVMKKYFVPQVSDLLIVNAGNWWKFQHDYYFFIIIEYWKVIKIEISILSQLLDIW